MRTAFGFAVGMLGLVLSQGQVQAQIPKKGSLDLNAKVQFADSFNPNDKAALLKNVRPPQRVQIPPLLTIVVFDSERIGKYNGRFRIQVANNNPRAASAYPYSIYRWNGTRWKMFLSGVLPPVKANETATVTVDFSPDLTQMMFKVEVPLSVQGKAEWLLRPARVWGFTYRCPEWQLLPSGFKQSSGYLYSLTQHGFEVSTSGPLSYRCVNWQSQTFRSYNSARVFMGTLPQAGLQTSEILERDAP